MATQKLMGNAWKLPTGPQNPHAFSQDAVTTRNGENGRKAQPKQDITLTSHQMHLNLKAGKITWEPNKMYVAKWIDKLTGKVKYVWFSDTAFLKQNREKEKFQKAETLGKQIKQIEAHILKNLD